MDRYESLKNEMRYSQQAESSAIRFYSSPKLPIGWQQEHVHTQVANLYPDDQLAVSQSPVSTRIVFTILTFRRTRCR